MLATKLKEGKAKFKDLQEVDFEAYYDSEVDYEENKRLFLERFTWKDLEKDDEAEHEHIKWIEDKHEQEFKESIKQLSPADSDKHFKKLADMVKEVGLGYNQGLFAYGRGGLGKSYTVLKTLAENEIDYAIMKGYTTPLALYHTLYENNGKVIVLDDFHGVFTSKESLAFLKSALDTTGKRLVSYNSTTDKLKYESKFEFTGRLIVCSNSLPKNDVDFEALKSRALCCNVEFTLNEVKRIIMSLAIGGKELTEADRTAVAEFIIDEVDEAVDNLTLRTLSLAYGRYKFCKENGYEWKEKVRELLVVDEDKKLMLELIDKYSTVKEAQKEWCEETGRSRATFYSLKRKMNKSREWKKS